MIIGGRLICQNLGETHADQMKHYFRNQRPIHMHERPLMDCTESLAVVQNTTTRNLQTHMRHS